MFFPLALSGNVRVSTEGLRDETRGSVTGRRQREATMNSDIHKSADRWLGSPSSVTVERVQPETASGQRAWILTTTTLGTSSTRSPLPPGVLPFFKDNPTILTVEIEQRCA